MTKAQNLWGNLLGNWLLLALLAMLAGCAQALTDPVVPVASPAPPVADAKAAMIGPNRRLALPRPADLGRSVEAVQMLSARYDGQTYVFEGRLSITPQRLVLVGLDGMGRRAMTVTWTGHDIVIERAPWLPDTVRPGSMLADIVVLYWPEAVVRKALAPAGCTLQASAKSRTVRCGNDEVLRAKYDWAAGGKWAGTVTYSNLAWGYEIEIESQEVAH